MENAYLCTPALKDAEYLQSAFGALGWASKREREVAREKKMKEREVETEREDEESKFSLISYCAEPWPHQLIMIRIPALDVIGTLQLCHWLQAQTHTLMHARARTHKHTNTHTRKDFNKDNDCKPYWQLLDSLSFHCSVNVWAGRVMPFKGILWWQYRLMRMCLCVTGVNLSAPDEPSWVLQIPSSPLVNNCL